MGLEYDERAKDNERRSELNESRRNKTEARVVHWCKLLAIGSSDRVDIHSKQLCVPLRIFFRVGNVSSLGMLIGCCAVSGTNCCPPLARIRPASFGCPTTSATGQLSIYDQNHTLSLRQDGAKMTRIIKPGGKEDEWQNSADDGGSMRLEEGRTTFSSAKAGD